MGNSLNQKKEINWINALKALCMIFVFFGHSELYYGYHIGFIDKFRLTFNVNAFFFISGYLLFWKQLSSPRIDANAKEFLTNGAKNTIINVIFRIAIPSILFSLIVFFPKFMLKGEDFTAIEFIQDTVGGTTFWFTSALVLAEFVLIALLITRIRCIWFYATICFILTFIGNYLFHNNIDIVCWSSSFPWHYKQALICMVYLALGGLYWKYESEIKKMLNRYVISVLVIIFVISIVFFSDYFKYITSLCEMNILGVLITLLSTILLIELFKFLPEFKILSFIGQNTMGYYFLSGAVPATVAMIVLKFVPDLHWWMLIIIWVINLAVATGFVMIMNKWFPWLFDLRLLKKNNK